MQDRTQGPAEKRGLPRLVASGPAINAAGGSKEGEGEANDSCGCLDIDLLAPFEAAPSKSFASLSTVCILTVFGHRA